MTKSVQQLRIVGRRKTKNEPISSLLRDNIFSNKHSRDYNILLSQLKASSGNETLYSTINNPNSPVIR